MFVSVSCVCVGSALRDGLIVNENTCFGFQLDFPDDG
jgi:hypothetical protein